MNEINCKGIRIQVKTKTENSTCVGSQNSEGCESGKEKEVQRTKNRSTKKQNKFLGWRRRKRARACVCVCVCVYDV